MAVIDEIQMIADDQRGAAWTNAFLGLKADVIHLCGDERALSLIKKLCSLTGDTLVSREYKRLNELNAESKVVDLKKDLKEGDCLITFTVNEA